MTVAASAYVSQLASMPESKERAHEANALFLIIGSYLRDRLPLFTQLPRRGLFGNSAAIKRAGASKAPGSATKNLLRVLYCFGLTWAF